MVLAVDLVGLQALQPGALAAATLIEAKEPDAAQAPAAALFARRTLACGRARRNCTSHPSSGTSARSVAPIPLVSKILR